MKIQIFPMKDEGNMVASEIFKINLYEILKIYLQFYIHILHVLLIYL